MLDTFRSVVDLIRRFSNEIRPKHKVPYTRYQQHTSMKISTNPFNSRIFHLINIQADVLYRLYSEKKLTQVKNTVPQKDRLEMVLCLLTLHNYHLKSRARTA